MKKFAFICLVALVAVSCSPPKRMSSTIKMMDIYGPGVIQHPVVAELDVRTEKVSGTAQGTMGVTAETVKHNAVANALRLSGADVLIEPVYEIQISGNTTHVQVTGFPGYYRNFRPAAPSDSLFLHLQVTQRPQTAESGQSTTTNSRKSLLPAVGLVAGAALLALVLGFVAA